jgi:hypothetical protein
VIARNDIDADSGGVVGNGIAFYNTVSGQSTIDIDGNTIVADEDGIVFLAQTSNAIIPVAVQDEIQIRNNTITGKKSGIRVAQNVDADRHDIRISGNSILGQTVNGITFDGQIGGLNRKSGSSTTPASSVRSTVSTSHRASATMRRSKSAITTSSRA